MQGETVLSGEMDETPAVPRILTRATAVTNRLLVPFGLFAVTAGAAMVVILHLLPGWGGVNPITGMLSDYGPRPDGWVFDTALDIMSVGSALLLVKMAWHGVLRGRMTYILMISWCVCLVGIASFTKDGNTADQTLRGALHLYSTAAACFSLPVAGMILGWQYRRDPQWRRFALTTQGLSWISVPCFLPFVVSFFIIRLTHSAGLRVPTGLIERVMGVLDVALLVVLAVWAHQAARNRELVATG